MTKIAVLHTVVSPLIYIYIFVPPSASSLIGNLPSSWGGLQLWEQCSHWPACYRSGHSNGDCDQPGSAEEETVRHHQPWHCGGEPTISARQEMNSSDDGNASAICNMQ